MCSPKFISTIFTWFPTIYFSSSEALVGCCYSFPPHVTAGNLTENAGQRSDDLFIQNEPANSQTSYKFTNANFVNLLITSC